MFEVTFEAGDVLKPEDPVLLDPIGDFLYALGLELVDALSSFFGLANQSGASQDPEMLGDSGAAHPEAGRQLGYRCAALSQAVEDCSPRRIGDSVEDIGTRLRSWHETIGNLSVTYCQAFFGRVQQVLVRAGTKGSGKGGYYRLQ